MYTHLKENSGTIPMIGRRADALTIPSLLAIFALALAIRLYPVLAAPEQERGGLGPFGDSWIYHTLAVNLCEGRGFSTTVPSGPPHSPPVCRPAFSHGPGYPSFMSLIYKTAGDCGERDRRLAWDRVRIVQCVMDSLCCILVFCLARTLCPESFLLPLLSSLLYCFSFYNIYYTRTLLSETLTTFLLTLFLLLAIRAMARESAGGMFRAGLVFGALLLCRPEYLLFLPLFALFIFVHCCKNRRAALALSSLYLLGAAVVVSPWTLRNWLIFKKPIVISAGRLGGSLYTGTFESRETWRGWDIVPDSVFINEDEKRTVQALQRSHFLVLAAGTLEDVQRVDQAYRRCAIMRIRAAPLATVRTWFCRIPRIWYQDYIPMYRDPEARGTFFLFYFTCALYAIITAGERRSLSYPIILLSLYITAIFMPLHVEPRYGVPLMPGIVSLAGIGLGKFILRLRRRAPVRPYIRQRTTGHARG